MEIQSIFSNNYKKEEEKEDRKLDKKGSTTSHRWRSNRFSPTTTKKKKKKKTENWTKRAQQHPTDGDPIDFLQQLQKRRRKRRQKIGQKGLNNIPQMEIQSIFSNNFKKEEEKEDK